MRHLSLSQARKFPGIVDRLGINGITAELPYGLELYARTPYFTAATIPADLKSGHFLTEDAWGVIRVIEGAVHYALEPPNTASIVLRAGESAVIEPNMLHHIEFVERGVFFIEFHLPAEKVRESSRVRGS